MSNKYNISKLCIKVWSSPLGFENLNGHKRESPMKRNAVKSESLNLKQKTFQSFSLIGTSFVHENEVNG